LAADGQATRLTSPGHPKGGIFSVAIDHTGHVFFSDYLSGNIFRTARGSTDGEKWVSELQAGDSDPVGIAFAPTDFASDVLAPGEGIVVDEGGGGVPGPNSIYRFSAECPEGETLLYSDGPDEGPLFAPRDVAIGKAGVYVVDTGGSDPGAIYELDGDGSLTLLSTSQAIDDPVGVAIDPTTEDLLVADAGGDRVVRVDPQTGEVANVVTGLPFWTMSAACLDIGPDGGQLFVTGADIIFTFRREASRKMERKAAGPPAKSKL
jgi:DNA-binding beta-propeller fold protein YncE